MTEKEERGLRKIKSGVVVSTKMDKTVVVRVNYNYSHPLYDKVIRRNRKYYAHHDGAKKLNEGDKVTIAECRPLSKLKRWRVIQVESLAS